MLQFVDILRLKTCTEMNMNCQLKIIGDKFEHGESYFITQYVFCKSNQLTFDKQKNNNDGEYTISTYISFFSFRCIVLII